MKITAGRGMKITTKSHVDHGLRSQHIDFIGEAFGHRTGFFIETVELPHGIAPLPCSLVGPLTGFKAVDATEVEFRRRGDRIVPSRMMTGAAAWARGLHLIPTSRKLTVIGGIDAESGDCILFTAYGGPLAPREVGDPNITHVDDLVKSFHFWLEHALLDETSPGVSRDE